VRLLQKADIARRCRNETVDGRGNVHRGFHFHLVLFDKKNAKIVARGTTERIQTNKIGIDDKKNRTLWYNANRRIVVASIKACGGFAPFSRLRRRSAMRARDSFVRLFRRKITGLTRHCRKLEVRFTRPASNQLSLVHVSTFPFTSRFKIS
jgi:hypothetical protein